MTTTIQVYIYILRVNQPQVFLGVRDIQSWIGDGLSVPRIEAISFVVVVVVALLHMQDPSSLTRNQAHVP